MRTVVCIFSLLATFIVMTNVATADDDDGGRADIRLRQEIFYLGEDPNPMYAVCRTPMRGPKRANSIIFIHGSGHSGSIYENTPDNRPGWSQWFLQRRFPVCVVDLPGRGRAKTTPDIGTLSLAEGAIAIRQLLAITGPAIMMGHSMGSQTVQRVVANVDAEERANVAGVVLLAPVGAAELIPPGYKPYPEDAAVDIGREAQILLFTSSEQFPQEARENYLLSLHPESARSLNEIVIPGIAPTYGPNLFDGIPTVMIAAEGDIAIPPELIPGFADFWQIPLIYLGRDWGFRGNGHLFMIERNSDRIAQRLFVYLRQQGLTTMSR